jgi:hypothetical protein
MATGIVAIVIGIILIGLVVKLWSSETFFAYQWRNRPQGVLSKRLGPKTPERAKVGIRGALIVVVVIGGLLLATGIATLLSRL